MFAFKRISLFFAFCAIILSPKFGKCSYIVTNFFPSENAPAPKEDEAAICHKKFEKGEINYNNIIECIKELREKNGIGTFISAEKAFKDYGHRSMEKISRFHQKVGELVKKFKNNGTSSGCHPVIWMPASNGKIPLGALSVDKHAKVFVSRAYFKEQVYSPGPKFATKLMPGKIEIDENAAFVPAFPHRISLFKYEVLIILSEAVDWIPFNNSLPINAVIGGYEEHLEKENIYIGRVKQSWNFYGDESYEVGPVLMDEGVYKLITTYSYSAYKHNEFEILVLKNYPSCVQK